MKTAVPGWLAGQGTVVLAEVLQRVWLLASKGAVVKGTAVLAKGRPVGTALRTQQVCMSYAANLFPVNAYSYSRSEDGTRTHVPKQSEETPETANDQTSCPLEFNTLPPLQVMLPARGIQHPAQDIVRVRGSTGTSIVESRGRGPSLGD